MQYDLIVIGGGPGGCLAAQRGSQAGMNVLLIDNNDGKIGGTCLNEGCIPTKSFLHSAKEYKACQNKNYGVLCDDAHISQTDVVKRKNDVIKLLCSGMKQSMRVNRVEVKSGHGVVKKHDGDTFFVEVDDELFQASNVIIATGSNVFIPPIPGVVEGLKNTFVQTSREILDDETIPNSLVVAGGGIIGLEMAYYFNSVGSKVTVIELCDKIGGNIDDDLSEQIKIIYKSLGIEVITGGEVIRIGKNSVFYKTSEETLEISCDRVLLSLGRKANCELVGLENIGLELDGKKQIATDEKCATQLKGLYVIGDANGRSMLAHTAYREAECVINNILGIDDSIDYRTIPSVIYTQPEVASIGHTKESAEADGYTNVEVVKLPMAYSGRYVADNVNLNGIFKVVFDRDNKTMLGAHMISDYASEIVIACSILISSKIPVEEMKKLVFPHPTEGEIIKEAIAMSSIGKIDMKYRGNDDV